MQWSQENRGQTLNSMNPTKNRKWTLLHRKGTQLLLHQWHLSY